MMMSRAVQQLMWFELRFQTQGQLLPSWTEWICVVTGDADHSHKLAHTVAAATPSHVMMCLCINLRLQHLSIRLLHQ